jgi:hypothetical protein
VGHLERMDALKYASNILLGKAEGRQFCRKMLSGKMIINRILKRL